MSASVRFAPDTTNPKLDTPTAYRKVSALGSYSCVGWAVPVLCEMKARGVRVDKTSDTVGVVVDVSGSGVREPFTGGTAAGLPAVTLIPAGILFCARIISG